MKIHLYKEYSKIATIIAPSIEEYNANPKKHYPPIPDGLVVPSTTLFEFPIVDNGIVRKKTREELIIIDNKLELLKDGEYIYNNEEIRFIPIPIDFYKPIWNKITNTWDESCTIAEAKEYKRLELKNARDSIIFSPYEYNGCLYDADKNARDSLFQASQLGIGTDKPVGWTTYDNTKQLLTNDDLKNLVYGIAFRMEHAFDNFQIKYDTVMTCTTVEEVKSIIW